METVLRASAIYVVVWLIFRLARRRTMAQLTTFDFVLLLLCSEAVQQALLGEDSTVTGAALTVLTFVVLDGGATTLRAKLKPFDRVMEGLPLIIMHKGKPLYEIMARERIDVEDILHAARRAHGLSRLDQIQHAVLEPNGDISIIPASEQTDSFIQLEAFDAERPLS